MKGALFQRQSDILQKGAAFQGRLEKIKSKLGESEFPWFPYDTFGTLRVLDRLLPGQFRRLLEDAKASSSVLDIGCGDGDLAFFLESLGFRVIAIDYPDTNHNGMLGIRKLKEVLNSKVEILSIDLDSRFELPPGPYDLVFVLGLLYHLKNPYYLMELLAQHARFCLLSTRVARMTPNGINMRDMPLAYLLRSDELNEDETNYWIFSERGLKRLVVRAGWEICTFLTTGDTTRSTPHTVDHDERAFCLIRNRHRTDPGLSARLVDGWHELEGGHWRWTERTFSVEFATSDVRTDSMLELEFVYPEVLMESVKSLQLRATVGDTPLPPASFSSCGEHVYRALVPLRLLQGPVTLVVFELDSALPPDAVDSRERGIVVLSAGLH